MKKIHFKSLGATLLTSAFLAPGAFGQVFTEIEEVIPTGATWDYLLHDDGAGLPIDPGTADVNFYTTWQMGGAAYDGPAFLTGAGMFGYGAVGTSTIATNVWANRGGAAEPPSGSRFSAYFRTTFVVPGVDAVTGLRVEGIIDDGAIVYINGIEAGRTTNMEGAVDLWNAVAPGGIVGSETEVQTIDMGRLSLAAGSTVTVSVSLHQVNATSSDLGMDVRVATLNPPTRSIPDNDNFGAAEVISDVLPATVLGRTHDAGPENPLLLGAMHEVDEPLHGDVANVGSIWYRFDPLENGPLQLQVGASDFAAIAAVYTGTALTNLTPVASTPEGVPFYAAGTAFFNATVGETYYIAVDGDLDGGAVFGENYGNVSLTIRAAQTSIFSPIGEPLLAAGSSWSYLLATEPGEYQNPDPLLAPLTDPNLPVDPALFGEGDEDFHTTWYGPAAGYNGPAFVAPVSGALLGYGEIAAAPTVTNIWRARDTDADDLTENLEPRTGFRNAAYFRTTFTTPAGGTVANLGFRGLIDDGAVIYINGVRVSSINFTGADTWTAFAVDATDTETGPQESFATGLNLPPDTEVEIAVSVHNNANTSSDMGFDLEVYQIVTPVPDFGKALVGNNPLKASFDAYEVGATEGDGSKGPDDNLPWTGTAIFVQDSLDPTEVDYTGNVQYVNSGTITFNSGAVDLRGINNLSVVATIDLRSFDTSSGFEDTDIVQAYFEGSTDGFNYHRFAVPFISLAGAELNDSGAGGGLQKADGSFTSLNSAPGDIPADILSIRVVVTATNNSGSEHLFLDNVAIGTGLVVGPPSFDLAISRNNAIDRNTITWDPSPDTLYEVFYGTDLTGWDSVGTGDDGTISHTPPVGDVKGFYRVERSPE